MSNAKKAILSGWLLLCVVSILFVAGCGNSQLGRQIQASDLEDPNPTVRILAIKRAGENKNTSVIPQLVDSLGDEDRSVRFYAIAALKEITGTDNGFDYKDSPELQAEAVERWRQWVAACPTRGTDRGAQYAVPDHPEPH